MKSNKENIYNANNPLNYQQFILSIIILLNLILISTATLRLPFFFNTPLSYNLIIHINIGSIFVYSVGILYKPKNALFICIIGLLLGELLYGYLFGIGKELALYLITISFSSGISGLLISIINWKINKPLLAMIVGGLWEILGAVIIIYVWFAIINEWYLTFVIILYPILGTMFDLFLIPIPYVFKRILKSKFHIVFLDDVF